MAQSTIPLRTVAQLRDHGYGISVSCDNHRCRRPTRHLWLDLDATIAENGLDMDLVALKRRLRCGSCGASGSISIVSDGRPKC